jgi:hypothetical protein
LLTLTASSSSASTSGPLTYSGTISPAGRHIGEPIALQSFIGSGPGRWVTIATGTIASGGGYSISHRFLQPGAYTLRTRFAGDELNIPSVSDELTSIVQQAEKPSFTIFTSSPTVEAGQPVTVSGVLYAPGSTALPKPGVLVGLFGHQAGAPDTLISSTLTAADGSYSFALSPIRNEFLQARTSLTPPRTTASLFEGVTANVSVGSSASGGKIGQTFNFTGTVSPDAAGRTVYLQLLGPDGRFHAIKSAAVGAFSTYLFQEAFGSPGPQTVRVRLPGGEGDLGGLSAPVLITVFLPEVSSLPPAS